MILCYLKSGESNVNLCHSSSLLCLISKQAPSQFGWQKCEPEPEAEKEKKNLCDPINYYLNLSSVSTLQVFDWCFFLINITCDLE